MAESHNSYNESYEESKMDWNKGWDYNRGQEEEF